MIHCYSLDLRVRIIAFVEAGHSCRAAARHFGVSDSCAIKLLQRQSQSGSPAPARQGRPPGTGKLAPYEAFSDPHRGGAARHHHAGSRDTIAGGAGRAG
jgi:hypothetical protein